MIEEDWCERTKDGCLIYGRTISRSKTPSDKAIIIVHGLGNLFAMIPGLNAAYKMVNKGYDCILFNLYGYQENTRRFEDGTIKQFSADLDFVLEIKASSYKSLFVAGHSYGGPTIINAHLKNVRAVSLWDPSYNMAERWPGIILQKKGMYLIKGHVCEMTGKDMVDEALSYTKEHCRTLAENFSKPMQIIHAGGGILVGHGESYHDFCPQPTDYVVIKDADHSFTQLKWLNKLVKETDRWFKQYTEPL